MRALVFVAIAACSGSQAAPPPVIANATPVEAPVPVSDLTLEPNRGDFEGGTYVRITGHGFLDGGSAAAAKIYFGSVRGEVIRIASDTELIAQAPGGKVGDTVDVLLIFEGHGEMKIPRAFTYMTKP